MFKLKINNKEMSLRYSGGYLTINSYFPNLYLIAIIELNYKTEIHYLSQALLVFLYIPI